MSDETDADSADVTLTTIAERIEDLSRIVARQARTLDQLVESDRVRARRSATGADLPLLVDLFALFTDAVTCAQSAEGADRAAFTAIADGLDRVISGRGGTVVVPAVGTPFDARTMEAVDVLDTDVPDEHRTVAALLRPGLRVGDRSVRAAAVVVRRHRDVR